VVSSQEPGHAGGRRDFRLSRVARTCAQFRSIVVETRARRGRSPFAGGRCCQSEVRWARGGAPRNREFWRSSSYRSSVRVVSLAKRTRGVGNAVILVIASVFITMKARVAWFAVMQCAIGDDIRAVSGIVGSIDRYAFWLSVISGIGGWAYNCGRGIPAEFHAEYRTQLRRFRWLGTAATGALIVSVISDALLTALRCLAQNCPRSLCSRSFRSQSKSRAQASSFSKFAALRNERRPPRPC
jgi:hypothetical protein